MRAGGAGTAVLPGVSQARVCAAQPVGGSGVITLADLRCDECGSKDIVAFAPGDDEVRDLFLLKRGEPVRCKCMECWVGEKAA